jgi:hypothetical protein
MARAPDIVPWIMDQCRREKLKLEGFGADLRRGRCGQHYRRRSGLVRSLLTAGVDTTVAGIGNAIWCFATNAGEFERLKPDPKLARAAFDEVLRYTSPVHSLCRTANQDTQVAGVKVPRDTKILCVLASANLDETYWPEATRFDITRKPVGHLGLRSRYPRMCRAIVARAEHEAVLTSIANKPSADPSDLQYRTGLVPALATPLAAYVRR